MRRGITGSVRRKVMVIILIATFTALLVSVVALLSYEARAYREFLINDLTTQADILALNIAPALAFDDPEAADANLTLLANRSGIVAGAVYTLDGELFSTFRQSGSTATFPTTVHSRGPQIAGDDLTLFHPVVRNDELLGTVFLQANYELADRIRDYLLILGGIMAVSLLVAALVSLWLQGSVTGPILAVTGVAQKIVRDRDFMLRAPRTTDDEIGTLVDAFNAMLGEVSQRQQDLEESNLKLQQESDERRNAETALRLADKRKDEFLATLAHELRNPLAPMVNALTLMETANAPPEALRNARAIIDRQLSHMVRLVEDLLDVSRISRGKLTIRKELVELSGVMKSAVDTVRPLLAAKNQSLSISLPDQAVYLQADPVRLSQVFSNLLNNATKYTPPDGCISVAATVEGGVACVRITDSGKGISPATLPVMFEMFVQDEHTDLRGQPGLGVGLALAKRLMELHGGTIEADSEGRGHGSTFSVRIPVEAQPAHLPAEKRRQGRSNDCARYRILLVDDNVDFATSLCVLLENLGHVVRVTHDAPEALAAAAVFRPDFAFLDIGLPTMDGYELARNLLNRRSSDLTLVAISGWGQKEDRRRAREAGFAGYLVKPVDLGSIRSILEAQEPDRKSIAPGALM
jgi:signal transduction histidine kinase/CheY-like chemotaxis protein